MNYIKQIYNNIILYSRKQKHINHLYKDTEGKNTPTIDIKILQEKTHQPLILRKQRGETKTSTLDMKIFKEKRINH